MSSPFRFTHTLLTSVRPSLRFNTFASSRNQFYNNFTQHQQSYITHQPHTSRTFSASSHKMGVHNITSKALFDEALKHDVVVVDCFATWCGPCKVIAPQVVRYSDEFPDAHFIKVDVDEVPEVARELNIRAMPTFILFKKGDKVGEVVGADPPALKTAIVSAIGA